MTNTHSARGLVWIDMQSPTDDEIGSLVKRYALHPLIGEELKSSVSLPKIHIDREYALIILSLPVRVRKDGSYAVENREIDFVIGRNFLVTCHLQGLDQLEYFSRIFETNAILNKDSKIEHTSHLFYYMVKRLYAGMLNDLTNIRDALIQAEDRIFAGEERKMVEVLSDLSRELIDFREAVRIHRDIWEELVGFDGDSLFPADFSPYKRDIRDEFMRINELISNCRELVRDLKETNDSLLNARQNEIIKTLTIINFVFIPATFISALFTIPARAVPLIEGPQGWNILLALMVVITLLIMIVVKKKKWL